MNVNKLIIETLSPLGYPVNFNSYDPDNGATPSPVYFTFNYEDDRAIMFADDEPQQDIAYLQVHLFAPNKFNYFKLVKQARSRLYKAGFSYADITKLYESETKTNHIVFSIEIIGESEREE